MNYHLKATRKSDLGPYAEARRSTDMAVEVLVKGVPNGRTRPMKINQIRGSSIVDRLTVANRAHMGSALDRDGES